MYRRIRDLREDKDLKQIDVAKILNVTQTTYSRYETGTLDIPSNTLKLLAIFHHVSTDYLLELTDNPRSYPKNKINDYFKLFSARNGRFFSSTYVAWHEF